MADYNVVIKLPNGGVVKPLLNESVTVKQLKDIIKQSIPGATDSNIIVSLSQNPADLTKRISAIGFTKYLTIDAVKKAYPMGFINNSSIEFNDGSDSMIMKLYVSLK
ncbi:hypothetical protein DICPUDRAFT_45854 [Dictyostelium purpureum]|uniref:Ubiquitin-like domain-containing protein n=1 Tax=Dictyostelium purpureum TaxID=5786 RepID=F0ZC85_DICPU|nr:uncharacterized protein DICPUDRAFT_45854 [Dictyostelium purpureum]EGC38454.1 hypothetical protein DICPUDRAFT_45854 [Dictyostelium purpureum]|eukprot:XP_003285012.1 hypothetical protein DICPUDRAFT_45854 [Dictyostelium purpureum]